MDYGFQSNHHGYGAPQTILQAQPQPQPPQAAAGHPYSSYYSNSNPNPYTYQVGRHEDPPQSAMVFTDGGVVQAADPYAVDAGYEGQAGPYGYQQYQHAAPYPYARTIGAASSEQPKRKIMVHSNVMDLESKKQRIIEGGAAVDAVRICTICNVVCNSDKVFASHLAGEKHVIKALGRNSNINVPNVLAHLKKMHTKNPNPKALKKAAYGIKPPPKIIQTFICEVCKIDCNCQESLNSHKMGRKHKAKLLKLQQSIAPKPPVATPDKIVFEATDGEAVKKTSSVKEDLQVKKDRILQGGANEGAIMECVLCDVVCNSKSVYDSHIAGKKHLAMVSKQEQPV